MDDALTKIFSLFVNHLSHQWTLALEDSEETSIKSQRLQEEIELLQKKLQQVQSENSEIKAALSASENQNESLQNDLK
jgi:hypothetical protein